MSPRKTVVHVTHETTHKVGGIGSVLEGLLSSPSYQAAVGRTVLIGPLFHRDGPVHLRLGPQGRVSYSSLDGLTEHPYRSLWYEVERNFGVSLVYGTRTIAHPITRKKTEVEVVLVDVTRAHASPVNALKGWLYDEFGIESNRYEHLVEYDQYVRLAPAALAVLRAMGLADPQDPPVLISHEYMGMPTILAAILDPLGSFKTSFYAHEVATVRHLIETAPGHDTMFYNVLRWARSKQYFLEEVFGSQDHYFKHPLLAAARHCDNVLAVGDTVARELRFLGGQFQDVHIDTVYNGVSAQPISLAEKLDSKEKLQRYARNLLGVTPDYVFSHVARFCTSKAFWRDLQVLQFLDKPLQRLGQSAVLFLLGTDRPARPYGEVLRMEKTWNWPVAHRETASDLSEAEAAFYPAVQTFNAHSQNVKVVFINQYGWSPSTCGTRMPEGMEFVDLRRGTDLEFGLSLYEPFGISPLEPLGYGALCVLSRTSGSVGLLKTLAGDAWPANVLLADYTRLPDPPDNLDLTKIRAIDQRQRDRIERQENSRLAREIWDRLPQTDEQMESLLQQGYQIASRMDWDTICRRFFLPALDRAYRQYRSRQIA
ncbi:MAG: hypothetical protein JW810_10050 [Sedimentisphaerales bacterium]|nr:hypothetical protein [Sedimentisphaerales bacterium]